MSDLSDLLCRCPTCTDPRKAMAADRAALEGCEVCGEMFTAQPRSPFAPFCSWKCWEAVHCECCGADVNDGCDCEISEHDGYDRETGPYSDRGCATHKCRV